MERRGMVEFVVVGEQNSKSFYAEVNVDMTGESSLGRERRLVEIATNLKNAFRMIWSAMNVGVYTKEDFAAMADDEPVMVIAAKD